MTKAVELRDCDVPSTLPLLLLKSTVLFPLQVVSAQIARKPNLRLLEEHRNTDEIVGAGVFVNPDGSYVRGNLSSAAVACRVLSRIKMEGGTTQVVLQGLRRIQLVRIVASRPYFRARVDCLIEPDRDSPPVRDLIGQVIQLVEPST